LGKPYIKLYGTLKELLKGKELMITISHCKEYATATAIIVI